MKYGTLSSLSLVSSTLLVAQAAPGRRSAILTSGERKVISQELYGSIEKRGLDLAVPAADNAQWNAIVKQAGPDLVILCREIVPNEVQVATGKCHALSDWSKIPFESDLGSLASATIYTPVTVTETIRATVDQTDNVVVTEIARETTSITVQANAQVTQTETVIEATTVTETTDIGPTATITSYTQVSLRFFSRPPLVEL